MTKEINLIVPTIIETMCTGFFGGCEKTHRGHEFRIEFHIVDRHLATTCTRDGSDISWEKLPTAVRKIAHDAFNMLNEANKARQTAEAEAANQ
jgi:hypothetical protein